MIFKKNLVVFLFLFALFPFVSSSQVLSTIPEDSIIMLDFRYGQLPNGMKYYIKSIESSQSKLDLRLLIKVGNNMVDKDQIDLAHILEHLAFKESKHFPLGIYNDKELFEKFGMSLSDAKAYIGNSWTQYIFKAPVDKPRALDAGFRWFKDIATGLRLSEDDIESEIGTVREELLMGSGNDLNQVFARTALHSKLFPCKNDYSSYFDQMTFTRHIVKKFYQTWYKTDLMAISVVGDINNLDDMENQIRKNFSNIPQPKTPSNDLKCDSLYKTRSPQFEIVERSSDSLQKLKDETVKIHMYFRDKNMEKDEPVEELKRKSADAMLNQILNQRFREMENNYNISYEITSRIENRSIPATSMELVISAINSSEKTALKKAFGTFHQISTEGVLEAEWNKAKAKYLEQIRYTDTTSPKYWVDQIKTHYIYEKPINTEEKSILKKWVSNLSLSEFNEIIKSTIPQMPEDIGVIAPNGSKALSSTEKEFRSLIRNSFSKKAKSYKSPTVPSSLLTKEEIKKLKIRPYVKQQIGETGALELELTNGVRLVIKSYLPSPGMNSDDIILHGFKNIGASSIMDKEKQIAALNAPRFVRHSGVRDLSFFDLKRYFSNTSLKNGVFPYINYRETGMEAKAELEDFEKMLQLVFLYFTAPRKDKIAFKDWKQKEYQDYLNPTFSLETVDFNNYILRSLGDNTIAPEATKRFESLDSTNFELGYDAYQEFFGNAENFTFIISGNFPLEPVLPLAQKYLGNLPNCEKINSRKNRDLLSTQLPSSNSIVEIPEPTNYSLENTIYGIRFIKKTSDINDWREELLVETLGAITNAFSWDLRFKKGFSIYDFGGTGKLNNNRAQYELAFNVHCSPEEIASIQKEFKTIITKIKSGNIPAKHVRQGLNRMQQIYSTEGRGNEQRVIKTQLYEHYKHNTPWVDPEIKEEFVKSISLADIVNASNKYFTEQNQYEFIWGNRE